MQSKSFHIFNIPDQDAADRVVLALRTLPGVRSVVGDHETKIFAIQWSDPTTWRDIADVIVSLDYIPESK
jgi:hypothetical protein